MGFFDMNIPYHESDRQASAAEKAAMKSRRLKLAVKAMELGYSGVAYNCTLKGVISESDRCSISLFPLSSLLKPSTATAVSAYSSTVKLHRDLLHVPFSDLFRQYTRVTLTADSSTSALISGNPILKSYDIVAVRPLNQNAFDQACQISEVDIIAIDFTEKLPFRLKQPMVKAAVERGVHFEITYSSFVMDVQARRQIISNCKLLVDWTRGKNIIFASGAPSAAELRGPYDVANLFSLLGIPMERAKAAISKNCRSVIVRALRKKHFYKETIKVEEIPSRPAKLSMVDNCLGWDPLSSGDGDLSLDDLERSFAASSNVVMTSRRIDFTFTRNGLPAHGLHINDLLPDTEPAPKPLGIVEHLDFNVSTEVNFSVNTTPMEQDGRNPFPTEQSGHNTLVEGHARISHISAEGKSSVDNDQSTDQASNSRSSEGFSDTLPEEKNGNLFPLSASESNVSDRCQVSRFEEPGMLALPTDTSISTEFNNLGIIDTILIEKVKNPSEEDGNCSCSEVGLPNSQERSCITTCHRKTLIDGSLGYNSRSTNITTILKNPVPTKNLTLLEDIDTSDLHLEEFNVQNTTTVVSSAQKGGPCNNVQNKSGNDIKNLPLISHDTSIDDDHMEDTRSTEMMDSSITSKDGILIGGSICSVANVKEYSLARCEPMQEDKMAAEKQIHPGLSYQILDKSLAGRERVKRRATHKTVLFPFKRLLNPRPFKRKTRKF